MKMAEAMEIINKSNGFMVSFEHAGNGCLISDHFPDKHAGEKLIDSEEKAWALAKKFAEKTKGRCINIYVTDSNFASVENCKEKEIKNR